MFRVITIMFRVITIMFRVITIMFRVITIKFICDYGAVYCIHGPGIGVVDTGVSLLPGAGAGGRRPTYWGCGGGSPRREAEGRLMD